MSDALPKLALVTGGVRRLGAHIAARLSDAGYALALHGHSDATPDDALLETLNKNNADWTGFTADFNDEGAAENLLKAVTDHFHRTPDLLVNNASLFEYDDAETLTPQSLEAHLRINMMVPTLLTTLMAKQYSGDIRAAVVNIIDQRIRNPGGDQLSYTLSKQALAESVRTLAVACADRLRVNGVAPGLTLPTSEYDTAQIENLAALMPLERLSSPDDIADAVLYLAEAASITGQIVFVDGGAHMKSFDRDFVFLGK